MGALFLKQRAELTCLSACCCARKSGQKQAKAGKSGQNALIPLISRKFHDAAKAPIGVYASDHERHSGETDAVLGLEGGEMPDKRLEAGVAEIGLDLFETLGFLVGLGTCEFDGVVGHDMWF